MTRTLLFSFCLLGLLLAACDHPPQPSCVGAECPVPCKTVADATYRPSGPPSGPRSTFTSTSSLKNCYVPGTSTTIFMSLTPKLANLNAERAALVFDIVRVDETKTYPSVILDLFDRNSIKVSPDIFSQPLPMADVKDGLLADISFTLLSSASAGNYALVISVFRLGPGQTPDQVTNNVNALAGRVHYDFKVER